jgi:carboxyl-terminal processing protease
MNEPRKFVFPLLAAVFVVLGMYLGFNLHPSIDTRRASKFEEVLMALEEKYVDSVNKDALFNDAINEMLHKLDPHSRYISKANLLKEQQEIRGSFGGIGVRFQRINDTVCVISAMKNGPAFLAGMRSGDQIISINGKNFTGPKITNDLVMENLRGQENTMVKVNVRRKQKTLDIQIERGEIAVETVDSYFMIDAKTGYIKINQFSLPTHQEFQFAAKKLLSKGMQSLILDLRGNPGGVMDAAVAIADEFLPKGDIIVSVKGKSIPSNTSYAKDGGMLESVKLSVLIDESSASAAEILSGAIQDNDRGLLYGRRTFGKGLVQQDQILRDGSSVRMTISRYYTPSGRTIQRPYSGDYESYMKDELRYREGELFNKDSIPMDKSKAFKTKKGRTVYGGGGIVPDVFVPYDSSEVSVIASMLFTHQVFSAYVFKYLQARPKEWSSVHALARHNFSNAEWGQFEKFAENQLKMKDLALLLRQEKQRLIPYIKEEFSRQLWQESSQIKFLLGRDKEMKRSIQ